LPPTSPGRAAPSSTRAAPRWPRRCARWWALPALALLALGCQETLDAGHNRHGLLPIDERNPVILLQDDWSGDWLGEYAVLLAHTGGPPLAGIVITTTPPWGSQGINVSGWNDLVKAAKSSGLTDVPDVTPGTGMPLVRPHDGEILSTTANNSEGAKLIVNASRKWATAWRPVVVACGTSLTEVADAYLIDQSVADRVVVVAAMGSYAAPTGKMGAPNGDFDPWADWIVAQKFRFVQASAYYDQTSDVATADFPSLPANALGQRFMTKLPNIIPIASASDQVALLVFALDDFAIAAQQSAPDLTAAFDSTQGPPLIPDPNGNAWVVTQVKGSRAKSRLWDMLLDSFGP